MNTLKFYFYYLESEFFGRPIIIQLTVLLIITLISLYLLSVVRILFIARQQSKEKKRYEEIKDRYETKVKELLGNSNNIMAYQIRSEFDIKDKGLKPWEKVQMTTLLLNLINDRNEVEYP